MLTIPVLASGYENGQFQALVQYLVRWTYPLGMTLQTMGVYLTMFVSFHRFELSIFLFKF